MADRLSGIRSLGTGRRASWPSAGRRAVHLVSRPDVPAVVFAVALFVVMAAVEPSVLSSSGLDLTILGIVPLGFAAAAQMIVMAGGDIDLSLGSAIGLVNVICATELMTHWWIGVLELCGVVVGYMLMGAVIELRRLPSLIVTFAFGFVWLGFALIQLTTPGGEVPNWVIRLFSYSVPGIPEPILILILLAALGWLFMFRSRAGRIIRAFGSRRLSAQQYARRPLYVRLLIYGMAGVIAVLAGFALSSQSGSGDPNSGETYLLMSIVAVIIGGAEFSGGNVWPVGAIFGATALGFVMSIDTFLSISSNLIYGFQGLLLIAALAIRRATTAHSHRVGV